MQLTFSAFAGFAAFSALSLTALAGCTTEDPAQAPSITVETIAAPHLYLAQAPKDAKPAAIIEAGDRLVLNGPLFDADGNPVGGYITQSPQAGHAPDQTAPLKIKKMTPVDQDPQDFSWRRGNFAWRNHVFGQKDDGSFFMKPYDPALGMRQLAADHVLFAIQNGPALVVNGENVQTANTQSAKTRIGIGCTKDNKLIVADSQDRISMNDLADALLKRGAVQAIYLDGTTNGFIRGMSENGNVPRNAFVLHVH